MSERALSETIGNVGIWKSPGMLSDMAPGGNARISGNLTLLPLAPAAGSLSIAGSLSVASTGGFFTNQSTAPNITKLSDRVFIGPTANLNDGSETWPATSWVSTKANGIFEYFNNAALQLYSWPAPTANNRTNTMMAVFGSRTSDNFTGCCSIPLTAFGINDSPMPPVGPNDQCAWVYYGTGYREPGCGMVLGLELDVANGGDLVPITPYTPFMSGATADLWIGAGGEPAVANPPIPLQPTSVAMLIFGNGSVFEKGIVFVGTPATGIGTGTAATAALTPDNHAICFYDGCRMEWYGDDTDPFAYITAYNSTKQIHIEESQGFFLDRASSSTYYDCFLLEFLRSRGTIAAREPVLAGDWLGAIPFAGMNSPTTDANSALIVASATENFSPTGSGSQIEFYVTPNGWTVPQVGLTLHEDRHVDLPGWLYCRAGAGFEGPVAVNNSPIGILLWGESLPGMNPSIGATCHANNLNRTAEFFGYTNRGVRDAPLAPVTNDALVLLAGYGYSGSIKVHPEDPAPWHEGASFQVWAAENWTSTACGGEVLIATTRVGTINSGESLRVHANGDLTIYGGTATKPGSTAWVNPSDPRLKSKSSIAPYEVGLDQVLRLNPIRYRYNGQGPLQGYQGEHVGLDADHVAEVMPSLHGVMEYQGESYGTVDSGELIYTLLNAVKQLAAEVAALKAK